MSKTKGLTPQSFLYIAKFNDYIIDNRVFKTHMEANQKLAEHVKWYISTISTTPIDSFVEMLESANSQLKTGVVKLTPTI